LLQQLRESNSAGADRTAPLDDIALCVEWIIKNKDPKRGSIVNMSLSGRNSRVILDAIEAATNARVLVVAAAGNHGSPNTCMLTPANSPYVISSAASTVNDALVRVSRGNPTNTFDCQHELNKPEY
jgi:subtilisin family serine protease